MKRRIRRAYSIQQAVTVAFALITLCIVSTALWIAYHFTIQEVRYVSTDYISQLVAQVNSNIDQYILYMEDVSEVVRKNSSMLRWVNGVDAMGMADRLVLEDTVIAQMHGIINARSDISNIALFTPAGSVIFDRRGKMLNQHVDYETTDWYTEAVDRRGGAYISSSHVQNIVAGRYDWVVSVSRAITTGSGSVQGVLLVDLNYSLINDLCESIDMGMQGYLFVADRQGNIIYHPQQQLIYSHIKGEVVDDILGQTTQTTVYTDEGPKLYISDYSPVTGWTVAGVMFEDDILQNRRDIFAFYAIIMLIFLVVAVVLSAVICSAITDPLKRLVAVMQEVQSGSLDRRSDIASPREAAQLGGAFNSMLGRIRQLMVQREKDQAERREIEFRALQAQINPHFLYNTLDSIIWMAENDNSEDVVEMTAALARLFRSSISESRELVPLSVELANIRSYLTIQQMRYREKLSYTIDIPRELADCRLPKLLLQPLVENSIYHGIKPADRNGRITVTGWLEGDTLVLEVTDNGVGMEPEQAASILAPRAAAQGGIGVNNVNDRIRLIFGAEYGLSYQSSPGEGTSVRVTLPRYTGEGGES